MHPCCAPQWDPSAAFPSDHVCVIYTHTGVHYVHDTNLCNYQKWIIVPKQYPKLIELTSDNETRFTRLTLRWRKRYRCCSWRYRNYLRRTRLEPKGIHYLFRWKQWEQHNNNILKTTMRIYAKWLVDLALESLYDYFSGVSRQWK